MPILETCATVVSLTGAIISAFSAGWDLHGRLSSKKSKTRSDVKEPIELSLETSLTSSGPLVKAEYDRAFSRLGQRFAAGDGTLLRSRS